MEDRGIMQEFVIAEFTNEYAAAVSDIVVRNLLEVNTADYPLEEMQAVARNFTPKAIEGFARWRQIYVALVADKPVGTASVTKVPEGGARYVLTVFILPEYQGRGVGGALMAKVEEYAKQAGTTRLIVPSGITACDFYRKLGFDYISGNKVLDDQKHYMMEKYL